MRYMCSAKLTKHFNPISKPVERPRKSVAPLIGLVVIRTRESALTAAGNRTCRTVLD